MCDEVTYMLIKIVNNIKQLTENNIYKQENILYNYENILKNIKTY